jgi:glutathione reductase (NADPH)
VSEGKAHDLAVIGSGTAAQVASFRVRAAGWSVALIDHLPFGGTCALRGCDPKKMLISGAEAIDMANRMRGRGVTGELGISWPELIAFKRTFTDPVPQRQEQRTRNGASMPFTEGLALPDRLRSRSTGKAFRPGMC